MLCIDATSYWVNFLCDAVGADADDDRIDLLLSQLEGKDIAEVIAAGREKLASVPAGGGAVAVAPAAASGGGAAAPAAETKKEEKVEEKEESDDVSDLIGMLDLMIFWFIYPLLLYWFGCLPAFFLQDMGFSLFD